MKNLFLFLCFFSVSATAMACFCEPTTTFCEYADSYLAGAPDSTAVVHAEFLGLRNDSDPESFFSLYQLRIITVIAGQLAADTVSLYGPDGLNCNGSMDHLTIGEEVLVLFSTNQHLFWISQDTSNSSNLYPIFDLPGCGPSVLAVEDGKVSGPLTDQISTVDLADIADNLHYCFDGLLLGGKDARTIPDDAISIFPNPSDGRFVVEAPDLFVSEVTLLDVSGKVMRSQTGTETNSDRFEINSRNVPAGVYVVVIRAGDRIARRRIVIK
ncbi:T9SS type A sorting domain-containing protein [Neolewinella antarctica]|uniref:Secretion system C-terminal sorting domain-containing protein n=1 Tax=Neolewinella antarctica TaxID=442734 RepID=A0ABX0X8V7_9BACT|nr:T9SS type A sorting domain-containing protein [Neolewinella antarctica]NJC25662.1 hypothetical protein [Neolewinella antarctica]